MSTTGAHCDVAALAAMHTIDPWGVPYRIGGLDSHGFIVFLVGEDGTADDIWSTR